MSGFAVTPSDEVLGKILNLLQCYYALSIEVKTGLRHSSGRSVLKYVQNRYGVQSRTKKGAMAELKQQLEELGHDTATMRS